MRHFVKAKIVHYIPAVSYIDMEFIFVKYLNPGFTRDNNCCCLHLLDSETIHGDFSFTIAPYNIC